MRKIMDKDYFYLWFLLHRHVIVVVGTIIVLVIGFGAFYLNTTLGWIFVIILSILATILKIRLLIIHMMPHDYVPLRGEKTCIYLECDAEPDFVDSDDSFYVPRRVTIWCTRKEQKVPSDGWDVTNRIWMKEDNTYSSYEETMKLHCLEPVVYLREIRANGLIIEYQEIWCGMMYLVEHDIARILMDQDYFQQVKSKACEGDVDSQYLLGCCYAYCREGALTIDKSNKKQQALYWLERAASQDFKPAYQALATFAFLNGDKEQAVALNEKYELHLDAIERYCSNQKKL